MGDVVYIGILLAHPNEELTAKEIAKDAGVPPDRVYFHMLDFQIQNLVTKIASRPAKYRISEEFGDKIKLFAELSKKGK